MADPPLPPGAIGAVGIRAYRLPLRDVRRPFRPIAGVIVDATDVLPVVLTLTPGAEALDLRIAAVLV